MKRKLLLIGILSSVIGLSSMNKVTPLKAQSIYQEGVDFIYLTSLPWDDKTITYDVGTPNNRVARINLSLSLTIDEWYQYGLLVKIGGSVYSGRVFTYTNIDMNHYVNDKNSVDYQNALRIYSDYESIESVEISFHRYAGQSWQTMDRTGINNAYQPNYIYSSFYDDNTLRLQYGNLDNPYNSLFPLQSLGLYGETGIGGDTINYSIQYYVPNTVMIPLNWDFILNDLWIGTQKYAMSYNNQFEDGFIAGQNAGYGNGYNHGYEIGNDAGYNSGYQAGLNDLEAYNKGYYDGGKDSFMGNFDKWIVPAIIIVLFGGGLISIISLRRRGD